MSEAERRLEAALESQGELIGSICHELKGILTGIDGGLYMLDSGVKKAKPERVAQGAAALKRNLGRMKRTVANVLYYVKDRDLDWQPLDLGQLASSLASELAETAENRGVRLQIDFGDRAIQGDELAVHSLLLDLLEYCLAACGGAGLTSAPSVALSASAGDDHTAFEVIANGFVIDEATRNRALNELFAPEGRDRSHLGLFVANKIVASHGGSLDIAASADAGTTRFLVKIPPFGPARAPG